MAAVCSDTRPCKNYSGLLWASSDPWGKMLALSIHLSHLPFELKVHAFTACLRNEPISIETEIQNQSITQMLFSVCIIFVTICTFVLGSLSIQLRYKWFWSPLHDDYTVTVIMFSEPVILHVTVLHPGNSCCRFSLNHTCRSPAGSPTARKKRFQSAASRINLLWTRLTWLADTGWNPKPERQSCSPHFLLQGCFALTLVVLYHDHVLTCFMACLKIFSSWWFELSIM